MTTNENETSSDEAGSMSKCPEGRAARKPYRSPLLQEWGSILELTAGEGFAFSDGDFTGSGAT